MEFTFPAPLGAQASLMAQVPVRKPPDSSKVEAAPDASKTRADMHNATQHGSGNDVDKHETEEDIRPDTLAGPPPTFLINVLEMEQKLQQQLARLEADRAQDTKIDLPASDQSQGSDHMSEAQNPLETQI